MNLISPAEYVRQAAAEVRSAKSRVYLMSMVFADHDATRELVVELERAAKRGIEVVIAADIFTYGEVSGGFLPFRYYSHGARETNRMVKTLKRAGVNFSWLGHGRVLVFSGRTHSKWCVVDDILFTFGGVNLYEEGVHNVDYMFRLQDARLADRIVEEHKRIQNAERRSANYSSVAYEHGALTVLFDGGIIGQSIIYRRVMELAQQASHITFVSQYCPTGRITKILRSKPTDIYFNRPVQADGLNRFVIRLGQFMTGLKSQYERARYLHAKFIIFTFEDGTKTAITGSHNFAYTGVLLGTREIALETSDPTVIGQLQTFIEKELKPIS